MNRIKTRKNRGLLTAVYADDAAGSPETAVSLLMLFRDMDGFESQYIALRDLERSAEEGSRSRRLQAGAVGREVLDALAAQPCGKLYLAGRYRGFRTGIGIDLKASRVLITLPGEQIALADEMVEKIQAVSSPVCSLENQARI